jgi:hypothetical protein
MEELNDGKSAEGHVKRNKGWDNLKPFRKGDDPERWAKSGRPKGRSLKRILKEILAAKVDMEDPDSEQIIRVDKKTAIAIRLVVDAYADEDPNIRMKAAKLIFDHTDPIKTKIDHTTKGESINTPFLDISLENRIKALEILESESKGKSVDAET